VIRFVAAAALVVAAAGVAAGAGATGARACGPDGAKARIAGRVVCLREGQRCSSRYEPTFRARGLTCSRFVVGFAHQPVLQALWPPLGRPLHIPTLPPGSDCPTTAPDGRDLGSITGSGLGGKAFGLGPVYPQLELLDGKSVLRFRFPPPSGFGTEWGVAKFPWLGDKTFHGRVLIRGRQLDGPNEVRFEDGSPGFTDAGRLSPAAELRLENPVGGSPATTRLRAPGCYAYQLDGWRFSRVVVFQGVPQASAS
jgi:hypothetical protein